jgi:hypothetical protein
MWVRKGFAGRLERNTGSGAILKIDVQGPQGEANEKPGGNVVADVQSDRGKGSR